MYSEFKYEGDRSAVVTRTDRAAKRSFNSTTSGVLRSVAVHAVRPITPQSVIALRCCIGNGEGLFYAC